MAKAIHLKIEWLLKRGQYLRFSDGRVPQLNGTITLNKKTEDAIARANKVNSTVVGKLEL
jgi:hypothetical protein